MPTKRYPKLTSTTTLNLIKDYIKNLQTSLQKIETIIKMKHEGAVEIKLR
jgi:hypothetical protein